MTNQRPFENPDICTTVEIGGDTYRIRKFTAKDGLKLARMIIAKAAPLLPVLSEENGGNDSFDVFAKVLEQLTDQDMDFLVDKCLRVCSKLLPAGPQEVIDETGHYGIPEAEYDMMLTLRLCVEAIRWGASDFFGGKGLDLSLLTGSAGK